MFTAKFKNNDNGHRSMPGFYIWEAIQGLALTQCSLHRRHLEVRNDQEARDVARASGRIGGHWANFASAYDENGYAGFCQDCKSKFCPINRNHICRILILYKMTIQLHMHYQRDLFVTDFGIKKSDIEMFSTYFLRRNIQNGRFGNITRHTIPCFRDYSESVYAGGTIDIGQLARPTPEEILEQNL